MRGVRGCAPFMAVRRTQVTRSWKTGAPRGDRRSDNRLMPTHPETRSCMSDTVLSRPEDHVGYRTCHDCHRPCWRLHHCLHEGGFRWRVRHHWNTTPLAGHGPADGRGTTGTSVCCYGRFRVSILEAGHLVEARP